MKFLISLLLLTIPVMSFATYHAPGFQDDIAVSLAKNCKPQSWIVIYPTQEKKIIEPRMRSAIKAYPLFEMSRAISLSSGHRRMREINFALEQDLKQTLQYRTNFFRRILKLEELMVACDETKEPYPAVSGNN